MGQAPLSLVRPPARPVGQLPNFPALGLHLPASPSTSARSRAPGSHAPRPGGRPRAARPPTHQQVRGARRARRGDRMQVWVPAGGRSEAQASVAAAAFRLSRWGRRLREGPRVSHASPSPPVNMAPGPPRTPPPHLGERLGRERGGRAGADARTRRPGCGCGSSGAGP